MGDATDNDACYEKALEVSNNRSARAKVHVIYRVTFMIGYYTHVH